MPHVLRTSHAETDLLEIWVYIAEEGGIDAADRVLGTIDQRCQALAEQPGMGRRRDELAPGLRSYRWAVTSSFTEGGKRVSGSSAG